MCFIPICGPICSDNLLMLRLWLGDSMGDSRGIGAVILAASSCKHALQVPVGGARGRGLPLETLPGGEAGQARGQPAAERSRAEAEIEEVELECGRVHGSGAGKSVACDARQRPMMRTLATDILYRAPTF